MAAPTITSIQGIPTSPVSPGTIVPITVQVSDADTRAISVQVAVVDAEGNASPTQSLTFQVVDNVKLDTINTKILSGGGTLTFTGPLTFSVTA